MEDRDEGRNKELKHEDLIYFTALLSLLVVILSLLYLFSPTNEIQEKDTTSIEIKEVSIQERPGVDYDNAIKIVIASTALIIVLFSILRFYAIIFEDNVWRYITTHGVFAFVLFYIIVISIPYFTNIFPDTIYALWSFLWGLFLLGGIFFLNNFFTNKLLKTSKYSYLITEYNYSKRGIEEEMYDKENCTSALARERISSITSRFYISLILFLVSLLLIVAACMVWKDLSIVDSSITDPSMKYLSLKTLSNLIIVFSVTFICFICFFIGFWQTKNKKEPKFLFWYFIIKYLRLFWMKIRRNIEKYRRSFAMKIRENKYYKILIVLVMVFQIIIIPFLFFFTLIFLVWLFWPRLSKK